MRHYLLTVKKMNLKTIYIMIICLLFLISCEKDKDQVPSEIKITDIVYSTCNDSIDYPSIRVTMMGDNQLKIIHYGAEFCCHDTGKVDIKFKKKDNVMKLREIDLGPPTYCFCKHKLEFLIYGIKYKEQKFEIIESEHSYNRDTLSFALNLNNSIDTLIKFNEKNAKDRPEIGEIISYPNIYEGKIVIIDGKFGGWSGDLLCDYNNMAHRTRSDVIIYDETGCLYLTGNFEVLYNEKELDPGNNDNIDAKLKVRSEVNLLDGKPILGKF